MDGECCAGPTYGKPSETIYESKSMAYEFIGCHCVRSNNYIFIGQSTDETDHQAQSCSNGYGCG